MGIISISLLIFIFAVIMLIVGLFKKNRLLKFIAIILFVVSATLVLLVWMGLDSM